ncbi:hypothetical protein FHW88_003228 [Mucilaginibacter sp. SG538B]|nr:hypothetical protein [Mucilaginibacter sp. SG538B]
MTMFKLILFISLINTSKVEEIEKQKDDVDQEIKNHLKS